MEPMKKKLTVNGKSYQVEGPGSMPLLWVLRDLLGMTGTKYGCGMAQCGACTVLVGNDAERACSVSLGELEEDVPVTTIEGLSADGSHPLQRAWVDEDVVQCGWCQSGQIMQAAALLRKKPKPSEADINRALDGNLCRCGAYQRIRRAVKRASELAGAGGAR